MSNTIPRIIHHLLLVFILVAMPCLAAGTGDKLSWPHDRLLPTFPTPAITIDCIDLSHANPAEVDLFVSLEGIVNRTQPRLACVDDRTKEGKYTWLDIHQLSHNLISGYDAIAKYRSEVTGLVVTDPNQPDTLNLATTLAGLNDELICSPALIPKLTNAPYHLRINDDLSGRFANKYQIYQFLYSRCWPHCTHRIFAGLSPNAHGDLRDYLIAVKSASVWLNPAKPKDAALLAQFFSDLKPAAAIYMGWWQDEAAGLRFSGRRGVPVLASDAFNNGSLFSGVVQPIIPPENPPALALKNKIYLSLILSDGDNAQYMQHHLKQNWADPARGSVPIGWTVSPLAVDLDPAMLNFYRQSATTNDCLIAGPSGAGYGRLDFWKAADIGMYTEISESYFHRSGLHITTIWLRATDAIADAFATNCPTLIGITSQDGGGFIVPHFGLPTLGLTKNYESRIPVLISAITNAAKNWNRAAPLFMAVQANGWRVSPADCRTIANALDGNIFAMVRPDQLFGLFKSAHSALEMDGRNWLDILPPDNLAGWTRMATPFKNQPGRTQWHLDPAQKILICDDDGRRELLRYDRKLTNCILHVEFRFARLAGAHYSGGISIRTSPDDEIWHQAQIGSGGGYLFGDTLVNGKLTRVQLPLIENRMQPAGQWNTMEISACGHTLAVWLNGAPTSKFTACEVTDGYLVLESDGSRIEFRNLKLKELPAASGPCL